MAKQHLETLQQLMQRAVFIVDGEEMQGPTSTTVDGWTVYSDDRNTNQDSARKGTTVLKGRELNRLRQIKDFPNRRVKWNPNRVGRRDYP